MPFGKIFFGEDGSFQWTIQNYIKTWGKGRIYSPIFTYNGLRYYVCLMTLTPSLICVMFNSTSSIPPNGISGTFQLRTDCNNESKLYVSTWNDKIFCYEAIINFDEFLSENLDWSFPKHLTILLWMRDVNGESEKLSVNTNKTLCEEKKSECESKGEHVSENANKLLDEEKNSEYDTFKKLQKDFEKLFLSKEDTDVTLEVQQQEFLAHRIILRARSPVFYAMFSHEMSETRSGRVTISDCDPKSFPDFLMYLYTGNTQHISEKNVCHLYTMSDKYEVEELKRKCSEFMKSHISVETFCDFISLALKHAEEDLICTSTDFFCRSAVEITKTVKWQKFLQENSTVGNELFQKALLKRNNN